MYLVALVMLAVGGFCAYLVIKGLLPRIDSANLNYEFMYMLVIGAVSISAITLYLIVVVYVMTKKTNLIYSHLTLDNEKIQFNSTLSTPYMFYLYVTNTLAILVTLTLAMPWAMIRTARYRASQMSMRTDSLDTFLADQRSDNNAVGEEVGEMFGLDIGI